MAKAKKDVRTHNNLTKTQAVLYQREFKRANRALQNND
ncbi:YfhE family protein [Pullulanibacillus camelliae]|nr:YfhE family protein [Pullulanibacillus camelliae]